MYHDTSITLCWKYEKVPFPLVIKIPEYLRFHLEKGVGDVTHEVKG